MPVAGLRLAVQKASGVKSVSGGLEVSAVRHLFRHLDDVASLRENPLAVQLFGGSNHAVLDAGAIRQRIRSTVFAALDSLTPPPDDRSRSAQYARRLRTIVERCDLHGEPRRVVAADLGICNRQLYRDRGEAFARLADVLRDVAVAQERHPASIPAIPASISDIDLQLQLAARLDSVGQFQAARTRLEHLADEPLTPTQRGLVTHRLVEALCNVGSIVEGRKILAKAKRELAKASCSDAEITIISSQMLAGEALLAWHAGDASSAIACAERGLVLLRPYHGPNPKRGLSVVVELSTVLAGALWEAGASERAIRTVESAKAFIDDDTDPATAAKLHLWGSQAYGVLPSGLNRALQENSKAFAIARRGGHARLEAIALAKFCQIYFLRGSYADALQYGHKALLVSELLAAPMELAQLLMNVARVAIALGNTPYAFELLIRAKQQVAPNDRLCAMIEVVEAEALTAQGRFEAAGTTAQHARRVFENCGAQKYLGLALCAEARACADLEKKRNAISTIRGAIDVAESFGSAYSLTQVYRASAEITGNKRHAAYAAEIDSALRG